MPSAFSTTNKIYAAVDFSHGDDWQTELCFSYDENGVMTVHDVQRFKKTIDGEANHNAIAARPNLPDAG